LLVSSATARRHELSPTATIEDPASSRASSRAFSRGVETPGLRAGASRVVEPEAPSDQMRSDASRVEAARKRAAGDDDDGAPLRVATATSLLLLFSVVLAAPIALAIFGLRTRCADAVFGCFGRLQWVAANPDAFATVHYPPDNTGSAPPMPMPPPY